jgi:hypothetical protein
MRDPFAGYDNWLIRPYEEAEAAAHRRDLRDEWIAENTVYNTACCGEVVDVDSLTFISADPEPFPCPHCGEMADIEVDEPDADDYDDRDYDDRGYDDFDGDAADRAADRYFDRW